MVGKLTGKKEFRELKENRKRDVNRIRGRRRIVDPERGPENK